MRTFFSHQSFHQFFQVLRILSHLLLLVTQLAREPVTELPLRYCTIPTLLLFSSLTIKLILFTPFIPRKSIHQLVAVMDPRTTQGDSLLHMAVSKSNSLKTQNFFEDGGQMGNLFPSLAVAKMLVECGARINATNAVESTPLHTASCLANFKQEVGEFVQVAFRIFHITIAGCGTSPDTRCPY